VLVPGGQRIDIATISFWHAMDLTAGVRSWVEAMKMFIFPTSVFRLAVRTDATVPTQGTARVVPQD
jgi:hypothetical protein